MSLTIDIDAETKFSSEKEATSALRHLSEFVGFSDVTHYRIKLKPRQSVHHGNSSLCDFLHSAPDAFLVTAYDGTLKYCNRQAEILFGYEADQTAGAPISMLFETGFPHDSLPSPDRTMMPGWRCLSQRGPVKGRRKNGELFAVEILQSHSDHDGESLLIYWVKDISGKARHEQRIAELEREVAFLSRHSLLGELATAITHELSQPLTAITNYTAAASRCWKTFSPEEVENGLALMTKAGDQAKRAWLIMHRLRQLLQHSGGDFTQDDLRLAVEDAIQLATLGAAQQGITVVVDLPAEPVMVRMDRVQIQVLIANLIRNAIDELSVTGGERKMWITLRANAHGQAELSVADTGHGIAPEVFENIFDPFLTTKPQGLGVGLAVSRRIAQVHGGRLAAENRSEGGAVFSFIVPLSVSESEKVQNE